MPSRTPRRRSSSRHGRTSPATYAALTGYFTARLLNKERQAKSFLDDAATKSKKDKWPYPIVSFLQGQLDEERLLSAASNPGEQTEAHCFIGLQSLVNGKEDAARTHFRWVKENGLGEFIEDAIATGELERLDVKTGTKPGSQARSKPKADQGG